MKTICIEMPYRLSKTLNHSALRLPFFLNNRQYDFRLQFSYIPLPATMSVKSNPFFTDFLCTWLGRVAKPTYCFSCREKNKGAGLIDDKVYKVKSYADNIIL